MHQVTFIDLRRAAMRRVSMCRGSMRDGSMRDAFTAQRRPARLAAALSAVLAALLPATSFAQADSDEEWGAEQAESDSEVESDEATMDADAETSEGDVSSTAVGDTSSPPDSKDRGSGIYEKPGETYLFLGARYRLQVVPQFVQSWFAEGGETLWVNTPGLEFAVRQDGFEYNFFAMLGLYSMTDMPFKGKTDEELAWETITADYQVLFVGADFLWSTSEFSPGLSMVYGAGIGLGAVFGEMTRTQAYPSGDTYLPCVQAGVPNPAYCDATNNHYNGYVEPSWADGGSSPLVFPWIAGQVGLRYKFHRNFVGRLEAGVTVTSLFLGLGADYGL